MHDSAERSNAPACHPDTRTKILADVRSWIADENRKTTVLWLHGPAGSGKTAICQTLAEQCDEDEDLAATFFFEGGSAGRDDARLLVTTIAYQIANSIESAKGHISNAVLKNPQQIFEKTIRVQTRDLLIKPLQQAVADALGTLVLPSLIQDCYSSMDWTNADHTNLKKISSTLSTTLLRAIDSHCVSSFLLDANLSYAMSSKATFEILRGPLHWMARGRSIPTKILKHICEAVLQMSCTSTATILFSNP